LSGERGGGERQRRRGEGHNGLWPSHEPTPNRG
jgi:hypothetical protein